MVNRGVSRGCGTCKQRRKKCDETRPVCKACIRTGRQCLGYKSEADLMFRHYNHDGEKVLPKHLQSVSTSMPSPPASPQEQYMTDEELADYALDVFFRDYCVHPADPALSRGYLQGVAAMIRKSGGNSGIANAARIIGIDGIGRRWGKEPLKQKAQWLYQAELRAFQTRMSDESLAHSTESFMIITLFGLYEILATPFPVESGHAVHALGITAILRTYNSPFSLFDHISRRNKEFLLNSEILTPPRRPSQAPSLDTISMTLAPVFRRSLQLFDCNYKAVGTADELRQICFDAEQAFNTLMHFSNNQHIAWEPRQVGVAGDAQAKGLHGSIFWPGRVDAYLDLWVAAVWATYRKGAIMLAAITIRCAAALPSENNIAAIASRLKLEVRPIVDQMLASIPYFLLADVWSAFRDPPGKLEPRPPVGGILCMHPIYITLLQSEVVSKEIAKYLRGCLKWMSDWQGMGQARVLVEDPGSTIKLNVSDAHTIVWAGMAT